MHRPEKRDVNPAEEHAARLARYEQALDAACGITRECESAHAAPSLQPRQRFNPVPFESVLRRVMALPGMVHHLEGIDLDGDGVADIHPLATMGPPPANPVGRMQWQALLENRQRAALAFRQRRARRKESNNLTLLATLQASDPYFAVTRAKVDAFVHALPEKVRRSILRALEETPGAFLELYKEMRDMLLVSSRLAVAERESSLDRPVRPAAQGQDGVAAWSGSPHPSTLDHQRPGLDVAPQGDQAAPRGRTGRTQGPVQGRQGSER